MIALYLQGKLLPQQFSACVPGSMQLTGSTRYTKGTDPVYQGISQVYQLTPWYKYRQVPVGVSADTCSICNLSRAHKVVLVSLLCL
jgi:hypothetical protein